MHESWSLLSGKDGGPKIEPSSLRSAGKKRPNDSPKLGPTADRWQKNSRSRIMRNQEWDTATSELDALDLSELVLGLLVLDAVDGEAALGVVDEAEVLARLLDGDDVHEAGGVGHVGADLAVDLDQALHEDGAGLAVVERILESVADEDDQGHAVAELVRTGRGAGGVDARQLVEKPVRGRAKALLVLLTATGSAIVSFSISSSLVAQESPLAASNASLIKSSWQQSDQLLFSYSRIG